MSRAPPPPDAAWVIPGRLGAGDRLEPVRRVLLEHGDAVVVQMMPDGGEESAARAGI
jgi:hypothetical protein